MSADLLRRAAAKIRATSGHATDGPWEIDHPTSREVVRPAVQTHKEHRFREVVVYDSGFTNDADAEHVALWAPDVAELVAQWLDDHAENAELIAPGGELGPGHWTFMHHASVAKATAVARRILGEDT